MARKHALLLSAALAALVAGATLPLSARSESGAPGAAQMPAMPPAPGMRGGGMMGGGGQPGSGGAQCQQGMMGGGGGANGGPCQPGMMGGAGRPGMMAPGMDRMMGMTRGMMADQNGMMFGHVEQRLTQLETVLALTEAQRPLWDGFADALRAGAASMNAVHQKLMEAGRPDSLADRLERHETMLAAQLATVGSIKTALAPFYAALTADQKARLDTEMTGPMSMM